ncbi:MAG: hypothetical protein EOM20_20795, partial [Spartobacteria bacterium]|nr:hypothetical protein [Spartobacteria bacterium]
MPTGMIDHEQAPVFLWFDSEFTSLELETAHLLQVAMLATDGGLRRTTPAEADINVFVRLPD